MAVFASAIVPNMLAEKRGREQRQFYSSLRDAAVKARSQAITSGKAIIMGFDDSQNMLTLSTENDEGKAGDSIATVPLTSGISALNFELEGNNVSSPDWQLRFYSDGNSDKGGIEVGTTDNSKSLVVGDDGLAKLSDGPIPDTSNDKWPAGDYEHRQ